jgi:7-cyano-7-deazaguanine synthase
MVKSSVVGLLLSGGLDSSILLHHLLEGDSRVQPFYIRCNLFWQTDELLALQLYLSEVAEPGLAPLVILDLPLTDVYEEHWSVTGQGVPASDSPDQAVFLPGRNALLTIKAAIWCQLHGINELALATLHSNPFPDATPQFVQEFASVLKMALSSELRIVLPFAQFDKRRVMEMGTHLKLERTFSCIAPVRSQHCGECNKCAERQAAFRLIGVDDLTVYVHDKSK